VCALTTTRPATACQVRYGPHSLLWHSPAAAADTEAPSASPADFDKCPATRDGQRRETPNTFDARPMCELDGPPGWPVVGNFLTYLKKQNRGQMHIVQVRLFTIFAVIYQ